MQVDLKTADMWFDGEKYCMSIAGVVGKTKVAAKARITSVVHKTQVGKARAGDITSYVRFLDGEGKWLGFKGTGRWAHKRVTCDGMSYGKHYNVAEPCIGLHHHCDRLCRDDVEITFNWTHVGGPRGNLRDVLSRGCSTDDPSCAYSVDIEVDGEVAVRKFVWHDIQQESASFTVKGRGSV